MLYPQCPCRASEFGMGVAAQQLRVRNMAGGRVNGVNTGFGFSGKGAVCLGERFLMFRKEVAP